MRAKLSPHELKLVCLFAVLGAGFGIAPSRADGPARDANSSKYAVYECKIPADDAARRVAAAELAAAPYDRNKLGCRDRKSVV